MHKAHVSILDSLRHRQTARFSELRRPTGMESDNFKFYIRKLIKAGLIAKDADGSYALTINGKEFANNLDDLQLTARKQAKLSMLLIISRRDQAGSTRYLFQERLRQPYLHYFGFLSGPVMWGEAAEAAAHRECSKQAGLNLNFTVRTVCRVRDFQTETAELLEDKIFLVLHAEAPDDSVHNNWPHGHNTWLTLEEFKQRPKHYSYVGSVLQALESGTPYMALDVSYDQTHY